MERSAGRFHNRLAWKAFAKWREVAEESKALTEEERVRGLEVEVERLIGENGRLQRDNERFQRIIDSGEWGRGRVEELAKAGETMRAERDAMLRLIAVLRSEYDALQDTKSRQEDEIKHLKERFLTTGAAQGGAL